MIISIALMFNKFFDDQYIPWAIQYNTIHYITLLYITTQYDTLQFILFTHHHSVSK